MSDADWRGGNVLPDGTHVCELVGFKRIEKPGGEGEEEKDLVVMEWVSLEAETIGDEVTAMFNILFPMSKKEFIITCSALWPGIDWRTLTKEEHRLEKTGVEARLNITTDRRKKKEFRRVTVVEKLGEGAKGVNLDKDPFAGDF